jgi:geranylgeranyl pyrophosphate synthase
MKGEDEDMDERDIQARFRAASERWLPAILELIREIGLEGLERGSTLQAMSAYHFDTGGKRLRALLPLLVAEELGRDPVGMLPFGAACEMLHNATLVHDDLQDGDRLRRGRATIWARHGVPQAINLGDAMFYWALLLLGRLSATPEAREAAAGRLLRETLRVIDGQEREFLLKTSLDPRMEDYFSMVEGKTSGLFALPIAGAAELCGADPALVHALAEASRHLGVLFQIQDDLLDLYGEKGRGERGSDIGEGKRSVLVVHAMTHASPAARERLRAILDAPREATGPEEVAEALGILEETGSTRFAMAEIRRRRRASVEASGLRVHAGLHDLLGRVGDLMLHPISTLMPLMEGA